jgi:D-lactate dehydrogenase (cytochrome)
VTGTSTYLVGLRSNTDEPKLGYRDPTRADFTAAMKELKAWIPEECLATDRDSLVSHGHSEWAGKCGARGRKGGMLTLARDCLIESSEPPAHDPNGLPGAVLYPRSTEDVVRIVKLASKHAIPLIPYAAGTSLEGEAAPPALLIRC